MAKRTQSTLDTFLSAQPKKRNVEVRTEAILGNEEQITITNESATLNLKNDIASIVKKLEQKIPFSKEDKRSILFEFQVHPSTVFPKTDFGKVKRGFQVNYKY